MPHLITDAMLEDASQGLTAHGMQPNDDTCVCGHDETPVRKHLAKLVADSITPALTGEVMALLSQVMAEPARSAEQVDGTRDKGVEEGTDAKQGSNEGVQADGGRRFGFTGRPWGSQPRRAG
jgi:hypothetical protein